MCIQQPSSSFASLSIEMFDLIMSGLSATADLTACSLVCKAWRFRSQAVLWSRKVLVFDGENKPSNHEVINVLSSWTGDPKVFSYIREVEITYHGLLSLSASQVFREAFLKIAPKLSHIKRLSLGEAPLTVFGAEGSPVAPLIWNLDEHFNPIIRDTLKSMAKKPEVLVLKNILADPTDFANPGFLP